MITPGDYRVMNLADWSRQIREAEALIRQLAEKLRAEGYEYNQYSDCWEKTIDEREPRP